MAEEDIPAWAQTLIAQGGRNTRILERVETRLDQAIRALTGVQVRQTALEATLAQGLVQGAGQNARQDDFEARLILIEKRLELRDQD